MSKNKRFIIVIGTLTMKIYHFLKERRKPIKVIKEKFLTTKKSFIEFSSHTLKVITHSLMERKIGNILIRTGENEQERKRTFFSLANKKCLLSVVSLEIIESISR